MERAFEDVCIVLFNAGIICKPTGSSEIRPGIVGSRNAQETWGKIYFRFLIDSLHKPILFKKNYTLQIELHELQERLTIEKQAWEENYMKKQDTLLLGREREMRDRLRRERDREIETVIQKLEEETAASKEECERNAEMRIR